MIILRKLKIAIILSLFIISFSNVVLSNAIVFEGKIQKNIYVKDYESIYNGVFSHFTNNLQQIKASTCYNISNNKRIITRKEVILWIP